MSRDATPDDVIEERAQWCVVESNCLDVLATLPAGRVDAVVTDPPHGIKNHFGVNTGNGIRTMHFAWDVDGGVDGDVDRALRDAFRALTPKGSAFCFCGFEQPGWLCAAYRDNGLIPKPAAWVKKYPPPAGKGNWWPSGFELAVYGYRPGAYFADVNPKRSNVFYSDSYRNGQPGKEDHPTQKPLGLVGRIVRAIVPPSGLVLDPFAGSGTTGVAALADGARAILIEREPKYCEIARRRCEAAAAQGLLFGSTP